MKVETQEVRPDIVVTLSHEEAMQLANVVGRGTVDYAVRAQDHARETAAFRGTLWTALKARGV